MRAYDDGDLYNPGLPHFDVDDVQFVQPVGFVWFSKPRYRVKAISRKVG